MRSYKDIKNEMEMVNGEIREARDLTKALYKEGNHSGYIAWKSRYNYLMIKNRALKNNSICAFANDYKKDIMAILNKYAGKKLGPKTFEKIHAEFKNTLNMSIYFSKGYYDSVFVGFLNDEGYIRDDYVRLHSKNVYVDNTLGEISDITVSQKYIEDIDSHILKLVKMQRELENQSQLLHRLANEYNGAKFEGMKEADYYKDFYYGYFEEWI